MKWDDLYRDAGIIMLFLLLLMVWLWLSSCSHKAVKELCPEDTHLISYPAPGHGPNPFK